MKKKKQQKVHGEAPGSAAQTATTTRTDSVTSENVDIRALIHDHRLFFDKLVDLIPSRFYLPVADSDDKPWFQGLSKVAKASLKQQTKLNLKLARQNRLDPEKKSQSSTLDILKQSLENQKAKEIPTEEGKSEREEEGEGESQEGGEVNRIKLDEDEGGNSNVTYEELRQKLRKKIELLRGNRGGGEEKTQKKSGKGLKSGNSGEKGGGNAGKKRKMGEPDNGKGANLERVESDIGRDIEFGKVRLGDDEKQGRKKKKRKISKEKELERVKRLEEVKRENPKVAEKESWRTATNRAMGVKVHDDPKLLKESIKKEKKRKEKHAEKWKERVETREKSKDERQQKRRENIAGRIHDKKMRKIAKREKKLMRPGFEGRKEGYITQD